MLTFSDGSVFCFNFLRLLSVSIKIEGFSHATLLALISEVGLDGIKKFPTAKHFASWLRLLGYTITYKNIMNKKTMNSSVTIIKWIDIYVGYANKTCSIS